MLVCVRRGWLCALGLIVGAVALGSTAPAGASGGAGGVWHRCAHRGFRPPVVLSITARGTSCANARRVVLAWTHVASHRLCVWADGSSRPGVCTVRRWRCTANHTVNGHTYQVVCRAPVGRREVRFSHMV